MATIFYGVSRLPILAGSQVVVYRSAHLKSPLDVSFLWEVEAQPDGSLVLVARDLEVQARVPLTAELARFCAPFKQASVLRLEDHPVEWRRWRQAGWDVYLMTATGGELMVCSQNGNRSMMVTFSPEDILQMQREPKCGERLLMEALYYHLHPRKAKAFEAREQRIPAEELTRFIQRYERKEKSCKRT